MTEANIEAMPTILLLYVKRTYLGDGKEGRLFYKVTADQLREGVLGEYVQERVYAAAVKKYLAGRPGIVYRVPAPDETTIYTSRAVYVGLWPDAEKRAEWQSYDDAWGANDRLRKEATAAKSEDAILGCLEPIRRAYHEARGIHRNLILARAVQYIVRGG